MISNCGSDERGKINGGQAGDQTGGEWVVKPWYSNNWKYVLRYPDATVRDKIAELATKAAENDNIGYDQDQRYTYWDQLRSVGYDPSKITTPCEADCSSGVAANIKATGILLGISALSNISSSLYTGNMLDSLRSAGFNVLTSPNYLNSDKFLLRGDILLRPGHTTTNLTDGGGGSVESYDEFKVPLSSSSSSSSNYGSIVDASTYAADYAVGRRVAELTPEPMHAYIKLYVGDTLLSTEPPRPNIFQEFNIQRLGSGICTASITLFDDDWVRIETIFATKHNWNDVVVEYGYAGSEITSGRIELRLTDYSIDLTTTGVIMHINAISRLAIDNLTAFPEIKTNTNVPHEAVAWICKHLLGLDQDLEYEETEPVRLADNTYDSVNEYPVQYIQSVIIPESDAKNPDLKGKPYFFYVRDGKPYFKPTTYDPGDKDIKTLVYQKGYDSVVKDASFNIKGIFGGTTETSTMTRAASSYFDTETKEEISIEEDIDTVNSVHTGEYKHTTADQSNVLRDSVGMTRAQAHTSLVYALNYNLDSHYEANITIVGDPTIEILDHIRLIVLTDEMYYPDENGVMQYYPTTMHHVSGVWQVLKISDDVSNGEMTTSMKLIRNADINEGIQLVNPKKIIK